MVRTKAWHRGVDWSSWRQLCWMAARTTVKYYLGPLVWLVHRCPVVWWRRTRMCCTSLSMAFGLDNFRCALCMVQVMQGRPVLEATNTAGQHSRYLQKIGSSDLHTLLCRSRNSVNGLILNRSCTYTHTDVNRQTNGCRLCVLNYTQITAWRGNWVLSAATGSGGRAGTLSALWTQTTAAVSSTKSLWAHTTGNVM